MGKRVQISEATALELKRLYETEGYTVEQLALELRRSISTIRRQLARVGTVMRPAGGPRGRREGTQAVEGIRGGSGPGVRQVASRRSRAGHGRLSW